MIRRKTTLIKSGVLPVVAAAGLAMGTGLATATPAEAGCSYGTQSVELPTAQSHGGEIQLAAHHEKKACGPCAAKACGPSNPCNPCAAKNPCNPCAAKSPCNPCGAKSK